MTQFTPGFIRRLIFCSRCVIESPGGFLCPRTHRRISLHDPIPCEALLPPEPPPGASVVFKGRRFSG